VSDRFISRRLLVPLPRCRIHSHRPTATPDIGRHGPIIPLPTHPVPQAICHHRHKAPPCLPHALRPTQMLQPPTTTTTPLRTTQPHRPSPLLPTLRCHQSHLRAPMKLHSMNSMPLVPPCMSLLLLWSWSRRIVDRSWKVDRRSGSPPQ
jgi:hypothetical protein